MFLFFNLIHFDILGMSPMFHVVYPSEAKVCGDCRRLVVKVVQVVEVVQVVKVVVFSQWWSKWCGMIRGVVTVRRSHWSQA